MHALFFEVRPHPGHLEHYFAHVARLKPVLARHAGLAFLDRYASLTEADLLLSHQLWDSEAAIAAWRTDPVHRSSQAAGRHVHFADYRIRVAERVLHWQTGAGVPAPCAPMTAQGAHVIALYGAHPVTASGFAAFESVNNPGKFITLATVDGSAAAEAMVRAQIGVAGLEQAAAYGVRRDYGLHERAQAPV